MARLRLLLIVTICFCICSGCASVARISDFQKTSEALDFNKLAQANYESQSGLWNLQTEYEYFVEVLNTEEDELFKAINEALINSGYEITFSNKKDRTIIGERGLRLNEWYSITGIYYRNHTGLFQVFFKNAITQDITGGWRENRARKLRRFSAQVFQNVKPYLNSITVYAIKDI